MADANASPPSTPSANIIPADVLPPTPGAPLRTKAVKRRLEVDPANLAIDFDLLCAFERCTGADSMWAHMSDEERCAQMNLALEAAAEAFVPLECPNAPLKAERPLQTKQLNKLNPRELHFE